MKKPVKKLQIRKETLRDLSEKEIQSIKGAFPVTGPSMNNQCVSSIAGSCNS